MKSQCIALVLIAALSASAQINLGGTTVPKDRFFVYLFIGQSNMAGRAKEPASLAAVFTETSPRLWNYNIDDTYNGAPNHQWIAAKAVIHKDRYGSGGQGPGMAALKELAANYPSDYYFGIIQNAESGATLDHYLNDGAPYADKLYSQIMAAAKKVNATVTIAGVVVMLGVIEKGDKAKVDRWASDMKKLADKMRGELGIADLPFLVSQYEMGGTGNFSPSTPYVPELIKQIGNVPSVLSNSAVIPTDWSKDVNTYMQDDHHYNRAGHVRWAQEVVKILKAKNWVKAPAADTQKPSAPTGVTVTGVTGTTASLSWTAAIDNVAVKDYLVYTGTSQSGTATGTAYTVTGLAACTDHAFSVKARDYAGNVSDASVAVQGKTDCASDTQPPSTPAGLRTTQVTANTVTLSWTASTDNKGVTGYDIYNKGTKVVSTAGATSATVGGLTPDTDYSITVIARDASGNVSSASVALTGKTAAVAVVTIPFRVNAGGAAVGGYVADQPWAQGAAYGYEGDPSHASGTGDVSGTDDDEVYRTLIYKEFEYRIRVPKGYYNVKLLFAEFWRDQAGLRVYSTDISGVKPDVDPVDIFKAVGTSSAYSVDANVAVDSLIIVSFTPLGVAGKTDPMLSGVAVTKGVAYTILTPADGQSVSVGDKVTITWQTHHPDIDDASVEISNDGGKNWALVTPSESIKRNDPQWQMYEWTVPPQINDMVLAGKQCTLRIMDYNQDYIVGMTGSFTVISTAVVSEGQSGWISQRAPVLRADGRRLLVQGHSCRAEVLRPDGRVVAVVSTGRAGAAEMQLPTGGLYLVRLNSPSARRTVRLITP